ncbi:MAG TPA: hypothetical protein VGN57_00485 [Pirellulaceae bacterium]|jgi:hypothetical protein|nr:hypothetical protein [Pirellulaceae bacterium]
MTPPADDLYAFLELPQTAESEAVRERIARAERRLTGKHGLTLTELSRQRALLLQAKRWLLPAERREEYDRARAAGLESVAEKETPKEAKPRRAAPAAPIPAAASAKAASARSPLIAATAGQPVSPRVQPPIATPDPHEDEEPPSVWLSIPVLAAALVAAVVLAFAISFGVLWALSDTGQPVAADGNAAAVAAAPSVTPGEPGPVDVPAEFIRADLNDRIVLTPTNARLIGPTIRLDGAENPPRIENWTSSDSVEWEFESPSAAIYQATLEYGMKPESEGNRFKVTAGSTAVSRTVGAGAYADGTYRDTFFLKIEKRGPVTLKIEPLDVVGPELMQFRELTLASRQKTAAP